MRNLREYREQIGLSREALSMKSGVNASTIEKIEMGGGDTTVSKAIALARALGTTVEALAGARVEAEAVA